METLHARIARPATAIVLTAIIILAAISLATLLIWQTYQAALTAGEKRAEAAAQVVAAHMEWIMQASDQALRRIDAAIGDGPVGTSLNAVENISDAVGDLPEGFQYSVYDTAGVLRLSSINRAVGIKIDDREYFKETKAGAPLVVSAQLIERLSGKTVFVIARRITRNGEFHGLATIAIPSRKMDEFWNSMGLGPQSTVSVVRTDGWVIARHPELSQSLNILSSPLFKLLPTSPYGTYHSAVSPADGLSRIIGYRKIDHWPMVALSGVEKNEALELFWRTLKVQLAFGLPFLVLLVGFAVWIAWLLRASAARNIELEQAIERNHFLFREIHHRVKNNLQAVSSLIRLQPLPEDVRGDLARRISAMVAVHEHIYQSDQFDRVEIGPYLERLVREIARSHHHDVEIEMRLQAITVDRDVVLPIGMIVNEVVANAFKYAFTGARKGHLLIELTESGGDEVALRVVDDGPGIRKDDVKKGMGTKLVNGFVGQIGGRYTLENHDGVVFTLFFPLRSAQQQSDDFTRNVA